MAKTYGCGKEICVHDGVGNHGSFCGCTYKGLHLCNECESIKVVDERLKKEESTSRIPMPMTREDYALTLLGAPKGTDLYDKYLSMLRCDPYFNTMFSLVVTLLEDKYDFAPGVFE